MNKNIVCGKSLKDWMITPKVIFTTRSGKEYFVVNNGFAYSLSNGNIYSYKKNENYRDDLTSIDNINNDIIKIVYDGKVIWEAKEYTTFAEAISIAIQQNKKLKYKDWSYAERPDSVLRKINEWFILNNLIFVFNDKCWEVI